MEKLLDIFEPVAPNSVALFARLFAAVLAIQLLISFRDQYLYFKTQPARIYGKPSRLLGRFRLPALTAAQFLGAGIVLLVSLILIATGFLPRLFILIALVCYFLYFNPILSLAYVQRKTNLLPFVLFVLLVSPSIGNSLDEPATRWELVLIKIAIAQLYFSAGLQKLRQGGWSWCNGRSLQGYLLENYCWSDQRPGLWLARHQALCAILSTLTLVFELTFWIIIFFPFLTYGYLAAVLLFHAGTLLTMRINYLKYLLPVYMIFFTDLAFWIMDKLGL